MTTQLFPKHYVISKVIKRLANKTGYCPEIIASCFDCFAQFELKRKDKVSFDEVNRIWEECGDLHLKDYLYQAA